MLVVVAEIAASLLPIADAGFASPGQALAPYVVAVAILLLFCAFNCLAAYRTGTLPGLKSFGVKAVLVEDGGPAEWAAVKKYAVEGFVGLFTLVGGLLLILKYTTDELGRTWFDRLTGIIYVDAHRPIEEESEEWDGDEAEGRRVASTSMSPTQKFQPAGAGPPAAWACTAMRLSQRVVTPLRHSPSSPRLKKTLERRSVLVPSSLIPRSRGSLRS